MQLTFPPYVTFAPPIEFSLIWPLQKYLMRRMHPEAPPCAVSCSYVFRPQYHTQNPILQHPHMKDHVSHRTQNQKQNYFPLCATYYYYYFQIGSRTTKYSEPEGVLSCLIQSKLVRC